MQTISGIRADTSISGLRNTKDRLQSGITLKSNLEHSQVIYIVILRSWESLKVNSTAWSTKCSLYRNLNQLWTNSQIQSVNSYLYSFFFTYFYSIFLTACINIFHRWHSHSLICTYICLFHSIFFISWKWSQRDRESSFIAGFILKCAIITENWNSVADLRAKARITPTKSIGIPRLGLMDIYGNSTRSVASWNSLWEARNTP